MKKANSKSGRGGQHETRPGKSVQVYHSSGLPKKQKSPGSGRRIGGPLPAVKRKAIRTGK
jgi:hypothetical protein